MKFTAVTERSIKIGFITRTFGIPPDGSLMSLGANLESPGSEFGASHRIAEFYFEPMRSIGKMKPTQDCQKQYYLFKACYLREIRTGLFRVAVNKRTVIAHVPPKDAPR